MSNRRKLPSEKRPRCQTCRTPLVLKDGYGLVCAECGTAPSPGAATEGGGE